ncbi:MAG: glycosyltransferase family 4 protein, partial [Bacillota bacterium]
RLPKLVSYNLGLLKHISRLKKEDVLVVNYPEHFPPVCWHAGAVVLSHGATWTHEQNRIRRKLRKAAAEFSFRRAKKMVANDTFFYREMGLDIAPQQGMFTEVVPGKWFIPNCIDTQVFTQVQPAAGLADLSAVIVPRNFTHARGVDLAVRAFAIFNKKFPETTLVLVGDAISDNAASLAYKEQVMGIVKNAGLQGKVLHLGSVPWHDMPSVYSAAAMTLIPTRCSEGTSLSALESMACGTAALSTAVEGLLDLPTEKCRVDVEDISEKMAAVYGNRESIGRRQQEAVRTVYNMDNWAGAWLAVVNS